MKKIKVMVVDDSAVVRKILQSIINADPSMQVVYCAKDPYEARDALIEYQPDVITLDIEMPKMDGVTFLQKYMKILPTPTIIISSLAESGKEITIKALESGAIDFITKNKIGISDHLESLSSEIVEKIKSAAKVKLDFNPKFNQKPSNTKVKLVDTTEKIIAIGASTGGVEHLARIVPLLSTTLPGIVVVQHMPEGFTASFAKRLNEISSIKVKEAEHDDRLVSGSMLIAPGGKKHLEIVRKGGHYHVVLKEGDKVTFNRPSVDVLFSSVARQAGKNALCLLMTGMGKDGAAGLQKCQEVGAYTMIQSERSCVVFGMPGEAKKLNAYDLECDLENIPQVIFEKINVL